MNETIISSETLEDIKTILSYIADEDQHFENYIEENFEFPENEKKVEEWEKLGNIQKEVA